MFATKPSDRFPCGEPIFPDDEDPWWLTDVQRKPTTEPAPPADEDGPAQEEEAVDEVDEQTDDEDPPSEEADEDPPNDAAGEDVGDSQPLERPPRVAWDRGATPYFERQAGAHCGMHALNNAVGRQWRAVEDMRFAVDDYLKMSRSEGLPEVRAEHMKPSGWYSSEVMSHAVNTTSMHRSGAIEYVLSLEPLHMNPGVLRTSVGAVVNIRNRHWCAIRQIGKQIWFLDSQEPQPLPMFYAEYKAFILRHRNAFPLRAAR